MRTVCFEFDPSKFLTDIRVQSMTLEQEGAYLRLLCACWSHGSIPDNPLALSMLCRQIDPEKLCLVLQMFVAGPTPGTLVHPDFEQQRLRRLNRRKQASAAGKKGMASRWGEASNPRARPKPIPAPDPEPEQEAMEEPVRPPPKEAEPESETNDQPVRRPAGRWIAYPSWMPQELRRAFDQWKEHLLERDVRPTTMTQRTWHLECQRVGIKKAEEAIRFSISKGAKSVLWHGGAVSGDYGLPKPEETRDSRKTGITDRTQIKRL